MAESYSNRSKTLWEKQKLRVTSKFLLFPQVFSNTCTADEFLDWSKLKEFADIKITVTEKLKFVLGRLENIVGKGENAGYSLFSPFPTMFSKVFFSKVIKSWDCVLKSLSSITHFSLLTFQKQYLW